MNLIKSNGTGKPTLREVSFNRSAGFGKIVIKGTLSVCQGVDDPVIEIFNAVQLFKQAVVLDRYGKELVNFTPLFPEKSKGTISYKLMPSKPAGISVEKFLSDAEETFDIFYKDLFVASFNQFLNDDNEMCNYNGYNLYEACMKRIEEEPDPKKRSYDIRTIRMLLGDFINFIGLPLPKSKSAYSRQAALLSEELLASTKYGSSVISFFHDPNKVKELIEA